MAVVLDEVVDEDYEPTQQEIHEYGEWLGMDLDQDQELLWIAREGLKAPLPKSWKPCQSSDGDIFYFNFETGDSVWDHPCDDHYRRMYRRAKARRDAPQRLVSISGSLNEPRQLTVTCTGSLNGTVIACLVLKPNSKVRTLRSALAKQLEIAKRCIRLLLPDGRPLTDADDRTSLGQVLGFVSALDGEADERRKDKVEKDREHEVKIEEEKTRNPKSAKVAGKYDCEPPKTVMLKSFVEEDYEPEEGDVQKYAEWLGMDLEKDADLLWVAREGLKAPLPQNWKPCKTSSGEIFYHNTDTCKSFWDHPCDDHYRRLIKEVRERQNALRMSVREAMSEPGSSDQMPSAAVNISANASSSSRECPTPLAVVSEASSSSSSPTSPSSELCCSPSMSSFHTEAPRQRTPKILPPLELRSSVASLDEGGTLS